MKTEETELSEVACSPGDVSCELYRDFSVLSRLPVFSGVPKEIVKMWAYFSKRQTFAPGRMLLTQGERLERAHCIVSGTARAFFTHDDRTTELFTLKSLDLFGELALLARLVSPVGVAAETEVVSLSLDRRSFWKVYEKFPRSLHHAVDQIVRMRVDRQKSEIMDQLRQNPGAECMLPLLRGLFI